MPVPYLGNINENDTIEVPFNTFDSDGASCTITDFANTDVHIHKDGGLTQRNNAAGVTVSIDYDGITGNHLVVIDTSDDTVADFWVTGSNYAVRIEGVTINGQTVNAWIGSFSIENRYMRGTNSAALAATAALEASLSDGSITLHSDYDAAKTAAAAGAQMDLVNAPNNTALTAIGTKLEAMMLDEGDATALLAAISAKVEEFLINEGDATATLAAIASAVNSAVVAGTVGTNVAAILEDTGTTVPGLIAALNNVSSADVLAQCSSALNTYDGPTNAEMEARTLVAASYATAANQTTIQKRTEMDIAVDRTQTPWQAVYYERGTDVELFRKDLTQPDGSNVTAETHRIGGYRGP